MISAEDALTKVMETTYSFGMESVTLEKSIGRILASPIIADRDFPPFDRVTMDGIAISYDSYNNGQREYPIESIAPAGSPQVRLYDNTKCIEVMTGAVLPSHTDTVIRYEDVTINEQKCLLNVSVREKQNVHNQGSDHKVSEVLLKVGHKIKAIDINVLASVGLSNIEVRKYPKIAIISSGDELVPIDHTPLPHQIRRSNVHMLMARLTELNVQSDQYHFRDDKAGIEEELDKMMATYDVIIMSGGVSKGKFDFIPGALEHLGVEKIFHRVAQRPGKPFWFGQKNNAVTVFAFPGNPVSTLACFHQYFIPWLYTCIGQENKMITVKLNNDVEFLPDLTLFAQAKLDIYNGELKANVNKGNGSGDMVHPTLMDGFVVFPSGKKLYKAGDIYQFLPFHSIIS